MIIKPLFYAIGLFALSLNVIEDSSLSPSKKSNASIYLNMSNGKFNFGDLQNYSNLRTLDLSNNLLKSLPQNLNNLKDLSHLILNGNHDFDFNSLYESINSPLMKLSAFDYQLINVPMGINK